jgi:hypothetical protein
MDAILDLQSENLAVFRGVCKQEVRSMR